MLFFFLQFFSWRRQGTNNNTLSHKREQSALENGRAEKCFLEETTTKLQLIHCRLNIFTQKVKHHLIDYLLNIYREKLYKLGLQINGANFSEILTILSSIKLFCSSNYNTKKKCFNDWTHLSCFLLHFLLLHKDMQWSASIQLFFLKKKQLIHFSVACSQVIYLRKLIFIETSILLYFGIWQYQLIPVPYS